MSFQIKLIPENRIVTTHADESILQACLRQGVPLRHGCSVGACRACKARIVSGSAEYLPLSQNALTPVEQSQGFALLCRARATSDLTVETAEHLSDSPHLATFPAVVEKIEKFGQVVVCQIRLPRAVVLDGPPGQYIEVVLGGGHSRAYSIANSPSLDGTIELHIRHRSGGVFSDYAFNRMKINDVLRLRGPQGQFGLGEYAGREMVFVCTGTGFAPIQALVDELVRRRSTEQISVYCGGRTLKDIYFMSRIEAWRRTLRTLMFVPVLSRPASTDTWTGRTGYVSSAILDDFADLSKHRVYACGSSSMVQNLFEQLVKNRALSPDAFSADSFFCREDQPNGRNGD
jgi:CDP-4-dehydro-6-deoxyglucose reductase